MSLVSHSHALSPWTVKNMSKTHKLEFLREQRKRPVQQPQLVFLCTSDVIAAGGLGDELYPVLEQCLISALHCGQIDEAERCLKRLLKAFGTTSVRVRKLAGLIREAKSDISGARTIYQGILKDTPSDAFCVKRMVAMYKSVGAYEEAVEVLLTRNVYVDPEGKGIKFQEVHPSDISAFVELLNIYYFMWNLPKALHYAQELVLFGPHEYLYHTRHAELLYTLGQLEAAMDSYSQSLRLNPSSNNARAVYGLWLVAHELMKKNSGDAQVVKNVYAFAQSKLKSLYRDQNTSSLLGVMMARYQ